MKNIGSLLRLRLELHDRAANSHKYYQVVETREDVVEICWGRCLGRDSVGGTRTENKETAFDLIRQKQRKGYEVVSR
jgi:predicted DNA-binding WGR domain protein